MALSVCCGNCLDCWFYKSPYFASLPMSLPGTKSDWSYGNYLVCWFYKSPYFASLPMSLPGTKSDWSYGNYLVCWFYVSIFCKSPYVIARHKEWLELRQLPCLLILQVSIFWQVFMCHCQAQRATGATATTLFVDFTSPYFASLPMSLPGTKSDWSCGSCLVCWFYKSPYFDKSSCVIDRHEERLELRHTLEGHQLGVVSVDINSTGNCILFLAHFGSDWSSLGHSAPTSSPQPTASSDLNIMSWERLFTRLDTVIMFVIQ